MQTVRHLDSERVVFTPPQGERKPGISARHYKILVLPDQVSDTTQGGIALPGLTVDKEEMGQTEGILISIGGMAFNDWPDPPQVGDRVVFSRYAGQTITGDDGFKYRIMNDNDVGGIRE